MRSPILSTPQAILVMAVLLTTGSLTHSQTWTDFAHPDNPHRLLFDAPLSIPPLLAHPNEKSEVPVLVILLDFADVGPQSRHTPAFFADLVFGEGGGAWTNHKPSMKQIMWEASNGRVEIVPAVETQGAPDDGIVGWVRTECNPLDYTQGYCIDGVENGKQCNLAGHDACTNGGGNCYACDSWHYYRHEVGRKRAEAIRLANQEDWVDFAQYDTMNMAWDIIPGGDGVVTDNELAVMLIHAQPNCPDYHPGHADWGSADGNFGGGQATPTYPEPIDNVDGVDLHIHPGVMSEATMAHVLAHEFGHQVFGLIDFYNNSYNRYNPRVTLHDGTIISQCVIPDDGTTARACNDSCAGVVYVEDGAGWGDGAPGTDLVKGIPGYVARGTTAGSTGEDVTNCDVDDNIDVWYNYTPSVSEEVTIKVTGNSNPTLAVFDNCGIGNELRCTTSSQTTVRSNAGTTY